MPAADEVAPTLSAPLSGSEGDDPGIDLATIFRAHRRELTLRSQEALVVDRITSCRTAALGGHLYRCPGCGYEKPVYNPCQDRHCPKCHRLKQAEWVAERSQELLPIPYFHVVFTVPHELEPLFLANRKEAYGLLLKAAAQTLLEVSKRRLVARIGILAVLHTWTQTLLYHPHVHCIVTGGGISLDGQRWVSCRPNFFLSTRVLGEVYRGKLASGIERALVRGRLRFDAAQATGLLRRAVRKRWVVYAKPPFAGPEVFLKYISRYVHRVAIADRRIVGYDGRSVTFEYRDRARGNALKRMTLAAPTFLKRFLLHLLPKGFVKIRAFGLLANGVKEKNLARCRELIGPPPRPSAAADSDPTSSDTQREGEAVDAADGDAGARSCPRCSTRLIRGAELAPTCARAPPPPTAPCAA